MTTANGSGTVAGKVAFLTGAGGGIGRHGTRVRAGGRRRGDRRRPRAVRTGDGPAGREGRRRVLALQCDFRRSEEVNAALDQVVDAFGGLDVAFNNAGVEQAEKPLAELTEDEWDRVLDINVRGA
jgi:NAD(P)-dependent dehydrogenase (short-subunit alcohol dehydrogenase family)